MVQDNYTALLMAQGASVAGSYGWALLKVSLALGLICLLAYLIMRMAQGKMARFPGRGGGELRVLDRYPLSPRQVLWLVEVGGRVFLLGAGEGGIVRLAELDPQTMTAAEGQGEPGSGVPFAELLERVRKGGGQP